MRRTLLLVALALTLASARSAPAQSSRAYPMNAEDRIAETGRQGRSRFAGDNDAVRVISDDDENIGRAGAFPMNTLDRIRAAEIDSNRRAYNSAPAAVRAPAKAAAVSRPDSWRYRWFQNRWWYYGPTNQWQYWQSNRWHAYDAPTPAAEKP
jgi:hypothetical protein